MKALMLRIADSLSRHKGNCGVSTSPKGGFSLVAGAPTAISVDGGVIVVLGLSRERLVELQTEIQKLLDG